MWGFVGVGSFPVGAVGECGVGGEEGGWCDASDGALRTEELPVGKGKALAEGGCAGAIGGCGGFYEVEWSLEKEGGVGEGNGVSPGDVLGGVGCDGGFKPCVITSNQRLLQGANQESC